jgi:acetate kinase
MSLLIFNAGSSTLKCGLTDASGERTLARAVVETSSRPATCVWEAEGKPPVQETGAWSEPRLAVEWVVEAARALIEGSTHAGAIDTVAHRVVHGGSRFTGAVVVDAGVRGALADVSALAPLHNPPSLDVIDAAMKALPNVPHVLPERHTPFRPASKARSNTACNRTHEAYGSRRAQSWKNGRSRLRSEVQ